jgi:hydrogenase maturation protein HypF
MIPPDLAVCRACRKEMDDPADKRHLYPFIACTQCGPRYSITEALPYDRDTTTLRAFPLCERCRQEYEDPGDRRFHAQPIACPVCGPRVWLADALGAVLPVEGPLEEAANLLREGKIVAVKGLGGFHLAVDALNEEAVRLLRTRKRRPHKPLAVMCSSLAEAKGLTLVGETDERELASGASPILLLPAVPDSPLAPSVAPGISVYGVMLPYTPLHRILMRKVERPLVMTSGNRSDDPICRKNEEAVEALQGIADAYVLHDREIFARSDDSVVRRYGPRVVTIRRSRGYVPKPIHVSGLAGGILAVGADLKNTVCLTSEETAFLSQHIGDLGSLGSLRFFKESIGHLKTLLGTDRVAVAHDLHPSYLSTQWAMECACAHVIPIQHHHAHLVSCLAEHDEDGPAIGIAMDGTGYGADGNLWGGEFFRFSRRDWERIAHFRTIPLPGGDGSVRNPWRTALSYLVGTFGEQEARAILERSIPLGSREERDALFEILDKRVHCPLTSSCGRLFDAVAALTGLCSVASYEGMAAMVLEGAAVQGDAEGYPFEIVREDDLDILEYAPIIRGVVRDRERGVSAEEIGSRFHSTLVRLFVSVVDRAARRFGIRKVVLGGGVFQNELLTCSLERMLAQQGYAVLAPCRVPPNDGGLSLGQAVVAGEILKSRQAETL